MNITIKDSVGLPEEAVLALVASLIEERKPKSGSYDYTLESHGVLGTVVGVKLPYPIVVKQTNKRRRATSAIEIRIEKHHPL